MDEDETIEIKFEPLPRFYSDNFLLKLCSDFDIEDGEVGRVCGMLDQMAQSYLMRKEDPISAPDLRKIRKSLDKIDQAVDALAQAIHVLDREAHLALSHAMQFQPSPVYSEPEEYAYFKFGDSLIDGVESGLEKTIGSLRELQHGALEAKASFPDGKRGPKGDFALNCWANDFFLMWERGLKRKITVDQHKGAPTSQALEFALAALTEIDPKVTSSSVGHYLKTNANTIRSHAG